MEAFGNDNVLEPKSNLGHLTRTDYKKKGNSKYIDFGNEPSESTVGNVAPAKINLGNAVIKVMKSPRKSIATKPELVKKLYPDSPKKVTK